ncbi:pentapeptide repeat-containing protein [Endozoicomonas lisbonensis]|uniref:Fluoroquinolone resistance protein n=1 Tax=Endozoicomonas lisbonensis TaxID=3120522 RepID=A0ABV2SCZ5_9GAMM
MNSFKDDETEYYLVTFQDEDLKNKDIKYIEFDSCSFINCDLSESTFEKCKFIDCLFDKCNLSLVKITYSRFLDVSFTNSKVIGVDWTKATWANICPSSPISFRKCIINDSSFFGLVLPEIIIEECKAHDVDFREGSFREGQFDYSDLTRSVFNNTNLTSASFLEASNYDIDINFNNVKKARFTRYEATRLLESLDIELVD